MKKVVVKNRIPNRLPNLGPAHRYAPGIALPRRGYLPGRMRHPGAVSTGLVAACTPEAEVPCHTECWRENTFYLLGADCFNRGLWWEAHETWEHAWNTAGRRSRQGRFLQGLIQIAAAFLKLRLGNKEAAGRLFTAGLNKLAATNATFYMGLDTVAFTRSVRQDFRSQRTPKSPKLRLTL